MLSFCFLIVFAGEVDAMSITSRDGKEQSHYVEMKTSRKIDSQRQEVNFKRYTGEIDVKMSLETLQGSC